MSTDTLSSSVPNVSWALSKTTLIASTLPFYSLQSLLARTLMILTSTADLDVMHDSSRLRHCSCCASFCSECFIQWCSCHIDNFLFVFICEAPIEHVIFGISCSFLVPACRFACAQRLTRVPDALLLLFHSGESLTPSRRLLLASAPSFGHGLACGLHRGPAAHDLATVV